MKTWRRIQVYNFTTNEIERGQIESLEFSKISNALFEKFGVTQEQL